MSVAAEGELQGPGTQARRGGDVGETDVAVRVLLDVADRPAQRGRLGSARRRAAEWADRGIRERLEQHRDQGAEQRRAGQRAGHHLVAGQYVATQVRDRGPPVRGPGRGDRPAQVDRQRGGGEPGELGDDPGHRCGVEPDHLDVEVRRDDPQVRGGVAEQDVAGPGAQLVAPAGQPEARRPAGGRRPATSAGANRLSTAVACRTCSTANRWVATPSYSRWKPFGSASARCSVSGP